MNKNNKNNKTSSKSQSTANGRSSKTPGRSAAIVTSRRFFYKDGASAVTKIAACSVLCLFLSIVCVFVAVTRESKNVYFAVNEDKTLTKLIPLSKPNQKDSAVANWLTDALVDTFDFSYFNMKPHLNKATMEWFTDSGKQELLDSLQKTGNFDAVVKNKLIVGLTVDAVPLVLKKGNAGFTNSYLWKLEVPATITYRTESNVYTNKVLFTVTVARRSLLENSEGLGIARIVMEIQ